MVKKIKRLLLSLLSVSLALTSFAVPLLHGQSIAEKKITIVGKSISLKQVFLKIRQETGLTVFYDNAILNENALISLDAKEKMLSTILEEILDKQSGLTYEIKRNEVIIIKKVMQNNPSQKQQQKKISGKVTHTDQRPMPGVTVSIKGTEKSNITDADGNFNISTDLNNGTLIFSALGFEKQEVPFLGPAVINIQLQESMNDLDEIVVVGYGTQKKSDLTGAVGSIKGEALQERSASSLNQGLSGRVSGVNVAINSGRPGGRASISIRGNTSVSVANDPLYVIDGVILNTAALENGSTPIDYINPNDIESIEILKDASATAIYGARGANGVILVSTKRGKSGAGAISYNGELSIGVLPKKLDMLNAKEFLEIEEIAYRNAEKFDPIGWNAGRYTNPKTKRTNPLLFDANGNPLYDTDWQNELFRTAPSHNHQLGFTQGNTDLSYGIFLNHRDEQGIALNSSLKRYAARFVFDGKLKNWLDVGGTLSYNDQKENQVDLLFDGWQAMRTVLESVPIIPVKYPSGAWASNEHYQGMEGFPNPVQLVTDRTYLIKTQTLLGNVFSNIKFSKFLNLRTTLGSNIINQNPNYYSSKNLITSKNQGGVAWINNARYNSWQFENYLTYNRTISNIHAINAMAGLAWQHIDQFNIRAENRNFNDDYFSYNNIGAGSNPQLPTSATSAYGLNSYFGRLNYGLKNKYLATFTGRYDGSSKFGAANKFAFFPSAALAWKISEEDFLRNHTKLTNLKVRTSYGVTGNSEIPVYQPLAGMANYSVIFNDALASGTGINRLANPNLKWEKTAQLDAGLEIGLFQNTVLLEFDVYHKKTTDMLLSAPVPGSSGYTTVTKNIGSMENKGIELGIETTNIKNEHFLWSTTFNISRNKNKVLALTGGSDIFQGSTIIREGKPVGSFFGYKHLGTWGEHEQAEAAKYFKKPGDVKYADVNKDGTINDLDRVIIGKGIPDGFGTFLNKFQYKNISLTVDLEFVYGKDINYRNEGTLQDRQGIANSFKTVLEAWTPQNQNSNIAQLRPIAAGYNTNEDSQRIKDGSFVRGRNLLLAYNVPNNISKKLHLERIKMYASIQNWFLLTKYPGYDPGSSTSANPLQQGVVAYDYPRPRVFMFGLNITL